MNDLKPQLTMTAGPIPGSSYFLDRPEFYLGRDLANELPIPDAEISRRHARIFIQGNLVFIEDLGSTNGTFVNGTRISSPKQLNHGDKITLAENTIFSFSYPLSGETSPTPQSDQKDDSRTATPPPPQPTHQPVFAPTPQQPLAPEPGFTKKPKKMSGFLVFLLILIVILIVAGLVLVFMPESWWCAITFNGLPGCPLK